MQIQRVGPYTPDTEYYANATGRTVFVEMRSSVTGEQGRDCRAVTQGAMQPIAIALEVAGTVRSTHPKRTEFDAPAT